jgi:hypothetical protein
MENVKQYLLENTSELRSVVSELISWNGSLEHLDVMENDEEFFDIHFDGRPMEAVRAAHYGNYDYNDDYVRFNGYGNLESLSEYDLEKEMEDSIDDIVDLLIENQHNLSLSDELEELLEEDEEEDEDTCECGEELHGDGLCPDCDADEEEEE